MKYTKQFLKKLLVMLPILALVAFAAVGVNRAGVAGAQQDEKQAKVEALTNKLQNAIADAMENGEFTTDRHGERVYAGETAEKMERLHNEVAEEIKMLKARPEAERAKAIEAINRWNDEHLYMVDGLQKQSVQYGNVLGQVQGQKLDGAEAYYSEDYSYIIDPKTNTLLEAYLKSVWAKGDSPGYQDMTPRYNQDELEAMAREFVEAQGLDIDLGKLELEKGNKVGTFFFRWKADESEAVVESVPEGYKVCDGDLANPEFEENGVPCIMKYERKVLDAPFIQVGLTQGGQLIGYTNAGFFEGL